jgi:hypothetical protein
MAPCIGLHARICRDAHAFTQGHQIALSVAQPSVTDDVLNDNRLDTHI